MGDWQRYWDHQMTGWESPSSGAKVLEVSTGGVSILADGRELFLPYEQFPWFRVAKLSAVLNLECPRPGHLHWPDLDVDLSLESIEHPEQFPLVYR
jgi:hypothetical protein